MAPTGTKYRTQQEEEGEAAAAANAIHGDILEAILSHVPLIHLLPACHVSKSWKRAVSSSLAHVNPIKPWLLVFTQSTRAPHVTTTHAYDPRSRAWIQMHHHSCFKPFSALRSSHSTLLYMLSPTTFAFSFDPIHLTWHHAVGPRVWRTDPIVALVGHRVVVAGGVYDFEDDPLAVEMYDLQTQAWVTCQSMPGILKGSTASTWLSVAVDGHRMHVTEKISGVTYCFDPKSNTWEGPYDVRGDQNVYSSVTVSVHGRMMVGGLVGEAGDVKSVKLWEVKGEMGRGSKYWCEQVGEMPKEMVEKLKGKGETVSSMALTAMGDFVYIHNPSAPEWMIVWEIGGGAHRWDSIENVALNDGSRMDRMLIGCADVDMEDLHKAVYENRRFVLKQPSQKLVA